jgi:ComF family protein
VIEALRDVVLAPRCAGCGEPGSWYCTACRDLAEPRSIRGAVPIRSLGVHDGPLRRAIHRLKYGGERALADDLGVLVAAELARDIACGAVVDAIVPVPLHRSRALARGYDQATLLAEAVGRATAVPVRHALRRIRAGAPQVELDRAARAANVRKAFVGEAGSLRRLRVALVDDVATTGATLADAAAAARAAGARSVAAYVVAVDE